MIHKTYTHLSQCSQICLAIRQPQNKCATLSTTRLHNSYELLPILTPLCSKLFFVGTLFSMTLYPKCCVIVRAFKLQKASNNLVYSLVGTFYITLYTNLTVNTSSSASFHTHCILLITVKILVCYSAHQFLFLV